MVSVDCITILTVVLHCYDKEDESTVVSISTKILGLILRESADRFWGIR
jgi:hypothetical protein